jgi:hypothetical protein
MKDFVLVAHIVRALKNFDAMFEVKFVINCLLSA